MALATALLLVPFAATAGGQGAGDAWIYTSRLASSDPHVGVLLDPPGGLSGSATDFGTAVDIQEDTAIVGAPHTDTVHVYTRSGVLWEETAALTEPGGFGATVAIDGDRLVVGAPEDSSIHVFERSSSGWTSVAALTVPGTSCLGSSVALHGPTMVAGDPCASDTAYLYEDAGGGWSLTATFADDDDDLYGRALALSGDTLLVGGFAAHAYDRTPTGWSAPTLLSDPSGAVLDIDGDLAATGTFGAVQLFERNAATGTWSQIAWIEPLETSPFSRNIDRFGITLDLEGTTLLVGATHDDPSPGLVEAPGVVSRQCVSAFITSLCTPQTPGAAYVFDGSGGSWEQVTKLTPELVDGQRLATSVAVSPDEGMILVGAPGHATALGGFVDEGDVVHVFERASGTW